MNPNIPVLRGLKQKAERMKEVASKGAIDCHVWFGDEHFDVMRIADKDRIRAAIIECCERYIERTDAEIAEALTASPSSQGS